MFEPVSEATLLSAETESARNGDCVVQGLFGAAVTARLSPQGGARHTSPHRFFRLPFEVCQTLQHR